MKKIIGRKLDQAQCLRSLGRKKDVHFNFKNGTMEILDPRRSKSASNDLGNKSWGMIDFLSKQIGWRKEFVKEFTKEQIRFF